MKRRGFLKRLLGVAAAAVVSEKIIPDDGVALRSAAHPGSMGLAPIKAEGSRMLYDDLAAPLAPDLTEASLEQACITIKKRGGILTRADFSKQLADGLNKAFEEVYSDYEPDGWPKPDDNA